MSRVRIENASYVVTVDDADTILRDTTVVVEDGVITEITGARGGRRRSGGVVQPELPMRPFIDAGGKLLMPGLVNLHTHLPMTLLRGLAENVDLQGFLTRVWAAEGAVMDPDTVELGATLGAIESLLGGCTTQLDMYFHHEAAHRGAVAAGSRHVIGPVFFDGPGPDGLTWQERLDNLRAWPGVLDRIGGPWIPVAAMPHATYTCGPDGLAEVVTVLRALLAEGPRPGLLTTHVSENEAENDGIRERYGATPTEVLARAGWVEPDLPLVVGHGVHLSEGDRTLLAGRARGGGALPRFEPQARQRCASVGGRALERHPRRARHRRLLQLQRPRHVARDAPGRALLARLTSGRPDVASAAEVLRACTIEGARALGLGDADRVGGGRQARRPRAPRPRRRPT